MRHETMSHEVYENKEFIRKGQNVIERAGDSS
jgi:hypothetical protein